MFITACHPCRRLEGFIAMLCLLVSLLTISKEAAWVTGAMDEEDGGYTAQILIQR